MINLRKIDWLALSALDNAIRLHGDAISLYRDQRYSGVDLARTKGVIPAV